MGGHDEVIAPASSFFANRVAGADAKIVVGLTNPAVDAAADFVAWARAVSTADGVVRAELEQLDPEVQALHTAAAPRFFAFASLWCAPGAGDAVVAAAPTSANWYRVEERLGFDRSARPDEQRPWAGVKKTTPWAAVPGVDTRIWQGRYANHGQLALTFHATTVRYRQNVVVATNDDSVDAISELWWTNTEDLVERHVAPGEARALLEIDFGGFCDAARAFPTVTRHEVLRIGADG